MFGLIKLANEQVQMTNEEENAERSGLGTAGNAALATGGAASLAASHDRLLGRKRIFHGVDDIGAANIRQDPKGFRMVTYEDDPNPLSNKKSDARRRANLVGDPIFSSNTRNGERVINSAYIKSKDAIDAYDATRDKVLEENPGIRKGLLYEKIFEHPDIERVNQLDVEASKLEHLGKQYEESAKRRHQQLLDDPSLVKKNGEVLQYNLPFDSHTDNLSTGRLIDIDAAHIIGGDYDIGRFGRLKESLRLMPDYIKAHPGRFATGAGLAGTGLGAIGLAAHQQLDD